MIKFTPAIFLRLVPALLMLVLAAPFKVFGQETLETINQALRYSRYSRLSLKILPVREGERTFLLQMPVEKIEPELQLSDYEFSYTVLSSFQESIDDEKMQPLGAADIRIETDVHVYFEKRIQVPESQEMAIALLRAVDKRQGDTYYYHMDLISPYTYGVPDFWAYYGDRIPFDQNFSVIGEALEFKSKGPVALHAFYYPVNFDVPLPPMEIRPAPVPREVKVEYEGEFYASTLKSFEKEGYYFIQSDTNQAQGMMLRTVHDAFPKVKTYEEMVEMVAYISTRREHEMLKEAKDKKLALDQYWFTMAKDEKLAQKIIREYFKQIEFANILFTDYKEGWKTDRGMVYTVMGPPQEVRFRMNGEIWTYLFDGSNSKITFTFARVKNVLTPNYYILNRSRTLQPEWFKSITQWRNGQMAF